MNKDRYILEILIYRISKKNFYKFYDRDINKYMRGFRNHLSEENRLYFEDSFRKRYGAPWEYNQVYGAIRIFCTGRQIRGDLWLSNKKRFTRIAKYKNISLQGKAFEITIFPCMNNDDIYSCIDEDLQLFQKNHKNRTLDLECYENLKRHIDWVGLINED